MRLKRLCGDQLCITIYINDIERIRRRTIRGRALVCPSTFASRIENLSECEMNFFCLQQLQLLNHPCILISFQYQSHLSCLAWKNYSSLGATSDYSSSMVFARVFGFSFNSSYTVRSSHHTISPMGCNTCDALNHLNIQTTLNSHIH